MLRRLDSGLKPRNGHTLIVGIIARISGCANQKELSLDDQVDHAKQVVAEIYDGPVEYRVIATKGKGERLDRPELDQIRQELLKGELDLVVMEDMGRLVRGVEAVRLFGLAEDHGTRAISPNDRVDTLNDTWEEDSLAACRDHVAHNAHTSRRIKHKLMNRFQKFGGATARPIAGYIVPPGAKTYADWRKRDEATFIIQEGLKILKKNRNGQEVADYFNAVEFNGKIGFPAGPYCDRAKWDGKMALRFYRNLLLSGRPSRGTRHTVKIHESGRRISVANPDGPSFRDEPHLAHLDAAEQDELIALLVDKNAHFKRKGSREIDPRWRTPRKRTLWPGQAGGICYYCGHHLVWGGNGITKNLMCSASREWKCWNSVGFNGPLAAQLVVAAIMAELERLEGIDGQLRRRVLAADDRSGANLNGRRQKLQRDEVELERLSQNVTAAIKAYGDNPLVTTAIAEFKAEERRLLLEKRELERLQGRKLQLPSCAAELQKLFRQEFEAAATDSYRLGDLLRRVVPEFYLYLVRMCDGGPPLPRARVTLRLDGIIPDAKYVDGLAECLTRELTLDLFDPPPREHIRANAVLLASQGLEPNEIASSVSATCRMAVTPKTVIKALGIQEEMNRRGLSSPYVTLGEPPADFNKLKRHRNSKYRFSPREGYQAPPLVQ